MADARIFVFGAFRLIPERQLLLREGMPVSIGGRALDLLTALVQRPGEVMEKAELIAFAWPTTTVDESNLKVNIGLLRRALCDDPSAAKYIATVAGRGYRFIAPIEKRILSDSDEAVSSNAFLLNFDYWLSCMANARCLPSTHRAEDAAPVARIIADADRSELRLILPSLDKGGPRTYSDLRKLADVAGYGIVSKGEIVLEVDDMIILLRSGSLAVSKSATAAHAAIAACCSCERGARIELPSRDGPSTALADSRGKPKLVSGDLVRLMSK